MCSIAVTVTALPPTRLCRLAVFLVKPTFSLALAPRVGALCVFVAWNFTVVQEGNRARHSGQRCCGIGGQPLRECIFFLFMRETGHTPCVRMRVPRDNPLSPTPSDCEKEGARETNLLFPEPRDCENEGAESQITPLP